MNENTDTHTQPIEANEPAPIAAPAPAAYVTSAPVKAPRMWSANTVIAGGIATVLFSGLVGGFLGAWIDDDGHPDFMREGVMMQDDRGFGQGYTGPGPMMGR